MNCKLCFQYLSGDDLAELQFQRDQHASLREARNQARNDYNKHLNTVRSVEKMIRKAKELGAPDRVLTSEETAWLLKARSFSKFLI